MRIGTGLLVAAFVATACKDGPTTPQALAVDGRLQADRSTGDTPNYNLEVLLRGDGFGHVKFRQSGNDVADTVFLGVWVRDLEPNTSYHLQRATDGGATLGDGNCTGTNWLTLGFGNSSPQSFTTDDKGTATADFFRIFSQPMFNTAFDIHFHVVRGNDVLAVAPVVLTSDCYQFTIR
jgi:hypothetical protein